MKKEEIISVLKIMEINFINYTDYIYVRSDKEDDDANWMISFIDDIGYDYDTKEVVDYKLLSKIISHRIW